MDLPTAGDYAINISYLSPDTRELSVSVNKQKVRYFSFKTTKSDCEDNYEYGSSTVVPIELNGFQIGSNVIEFGQNTENPGPFIEYISVVPKKNLIL